MRTLDAAGHSREVDRRFSAFDELRMSLVKLGCEVAETHPFPPKALFLTAAVLAARMKGLGTWLSAVCSWDSGHPLVSVFLDGVAEGM